MLFIELVNQPNGKERIFMTKKQLNDFTAAAINLTILIVLVSFNGYASIAFKLFILSIPSITFVVTLRLALSGFVLKAKATNTEVTSKSSPVQKS